LNSKYFQGQSKKFLGLYISILLSEGQRLLIPTMAIYEDNDMPISRLKELELSHANTEQLQDKKRSDALATQGGGLEHFMSVRLLGSIASISLSTVASYWGFSPAAAILTTINADIGKLYPNPT
jgi:hypothetical protein